MRVRLAYLYEDDGSLPLTLLDEGQDFPDLYQQFNSQDENPGGPGWLDFTDFMRSHGVKFIDTSIDNTYDPTLVDAPDKSITPLIVTEPLEPEGLLALKGTGEGDRIRFRMNMDFNRIAMNQWDVEDMNVEVNRLIGYYGASDICYNPVHVTENEGDDWIGGELTIEVDTAVDWENLAE